jgi:hypothetical protein
MILLRAARGQPVLNVVRGPRCGTICTGMSAPDGGKQQVTTLPARRAGLRKRKRLVTRTVYPDQCCFRSSRAGFVDHAGR